MLRKGCLVHGRLWMPAQLQCPGSQEPAAGGRGCDGRCRATGANGRLAAASLIQPPIMMGGGEDSRDSGAFLAFHQRVEAVMAA
jgi:hypothetical protein